MAPLAGILSIFGGAGGAVAATTAGAASLAAPAAISSVGLAAGSAAGAGLGLGGIGGALGGVTAGSIIPSVAATAGSSLFNPFSLLFGGVRALGQFADFQGQQQSAFDQRAIFEAQQQAELAALSAFDRQNLARQQGIIDEANLDSLNRQRQALRERGAIRAAAAETGVLGITPIRQLGRSMFQEAFDIANIRSTQGSRTAQTFAERDAEAVSRQGRVNVLSRRSEATRGPNPFLGGLQIAGAGLSGFTAGNQFARERRRFR